MRAALYRASGFVPFPSDDRALERPSNLTGGAAGKVVAKLLAEGLVEEIQSRGSLPVWRRDGDITHTLRITKRGRATLIEKQRLVRPPRPERGI